MPLSADEAEGSQHGRLQRPLLGSPAPTSLAAALEVSQDAEPMAEELSLFPVSGLGPGSPTGDVELPPPVSRKVLEVITFLARHQPKVARELAVLDVPSPRAQSYQIALMQDKKGKRRAIEAHDFGPEQGAMEVLLELLGKSLCRRSSSHQEQVLQLMVLVLQAAHTAYQTLQEVYNKQNPVAAARQADSEALAAGTEAEAAARPSFLANSPDGPGTTPDGMFTPARPALEAGPTGSSAVTAGPSAFGAPSGAEPSTSADTPAEVPADHRHNPRPVLERLPPALVRQLPALLGDATTSDAASARTAEAIELLVKTAPSHKNLVLRELETQLQTMTASAVRELEEVRDGKQASMGRCSVGGLVCRLLQCVTVITKTGPSKTPPEKVLPEDTASLDEIAAQLDPLWAALSRACSHIEASLQGQWPPGGDSPAATRILPPRRFSGAASGGSIFSCCLTPGARHLGPLPDRIALRGASIERELVVPMDPIPLFTPISSTSGIASTSSGLTGGVAPTTASLEAHLPYIRFAEKHRRLLNTLVRHTPSLLEGSLTSLLRTPRLIEFDNKRTYFRSRVRTVNSDEGARHYGNLRICVRREHVFEDSFHQLRMRAPEEMKTKMAVTFQGEEGIDAGGVSREWYQRGCHFQPNPNSVVQNDEARGTNHLDFFKFVGRVVGKALFDGQCIDAYFTRSFYKHMLDQPLTYQDIEAVDPEYYKNLRWMLENDITDVLDLTFTTEVEYFGSKEIVELKSAGHSIKVTEENKREYVDLLARHRMTTAIKSQIQAFLQGFWDLIPKELVSIFNDHELELLISGLPEIDVEDLRNNTEYSGFTAASPVVQWFWEIVRGLDKEDLALLVQFVTGTSKVPLEGFKALQGISGPQKFQIHKAYGATSRLPTAHTCFNQLDLIEYESKDILQERLLLALHEGSEGFGFG